MAAQHMPAMPRKLNCISCLWACSLQQSPPLAYPLLTPTPRYGAIVLGVEILGGLAMLPYGLCLVMRVTNNQVPPPDDKGHVRGSGRAGQTKGVDQRVKGWLALPPLPLPQPPACPVFPSLRALTPFRSAHCPPQVRTSLNYHIRVVVPCYKEPLDVIQKTVTAALVAPIPTNCSRTGAGGGKRVGELWQQSVLVVHNACLQAC